MPRFLLNQWFLILLAAVLALGFLKPEPFVGFASATWVRNSIVATVLFLMALPLESRTMVRTLRRPQAALLASTVNMGLVPLMSWGMSSLATGDLATGLIVAAAAPCTLASAAVWTRRAGGNDAVAMLVTILTNATCFLTTPFWILMATGKSTSISLNEMIGKLGVLVVLPMVMAQLMRLSAPVAEFATRRKRLLGTWAQLGILSMVLIGAVNTNRNLAATPWQEAAGWLSFVWLAVLVVAIHLAAMWSGWLLALLMGLDRADRIAVAISGSQKTLMVGLFVAINYFGGLTLLPMVFYHVGQLVVDTIIADVWSRSGRKAELSGSERP